jgi:hypothetical protein
LDKPAILQIETLNTCNARCTFCPVSKLKRPRGVMSDELFKKIIDDAAENVPEVAAILPFLNGEPFLDKKIFERIAYINEKVPTAQVFLFTNGYLMTPEIVEKMQKVKITRLNVSLNAMTEETHQSLMGLPLQPVLDNIDYLVAHRPEGMTEINLSLIDWVGPKLEFFKAMDKYPVGSGVSLYHVSYKNWAGNPNVTQPFNKFNYQPCNRVWQMFVLWDGRVNLCCMDAEGDKILGDLNKQTILEVFNSPEHKRYRKMNDTYRRNELDLCKTCTMG